MVESSTEDNLRIECRAHEEYHDAEWTAIWDADERLPRHQARALKRAITLLEAARMLREEMRAGIF